MADTKIKNIATVDVLEDSTNKENILVESQGGLKRLPISKVKGSGGGGAGFDLMGKEATTIIVTGGGELIEWEDTTWAASSSAPTFEDIFGSGDFNQANVYKTNCTIINPSTGNEQGTYEVYGFYYSSDSTWMVAIPSVEMGVEEFESVCTIETSVVLTSSLTYAEIAEAKQNRPITAYIEIIAGEEGIPTYFEAIARYDSYGPHIQQMLPAEAQGKDLTILAMFNYEADEGLTLLVLFEAGTEQEPILGTVLLKNIS